MSEKKSKASKAGGKSAKGAKQAAALPKQNARVAGPEVLPSAAQKESNFRRKIVGTVTSDRMTKTVVVEVIRKSMHPMYKKYVRVRNKYKAHDELNQYKIGDRVEIMEHRPLSAEKRWLVTRLISRPVEA